MITVIGEATTTTAGSSSRTSPQRPPNKSPRNEAGDAGTGTPGNDNRPEKAPSKPATTPLESSATENTAEAKGKAGSINPGDNSDLMSRLQQFMPLMKSANKDLFSSSSSTEMPFPAPPTALGGNTVVGGSGVRLDDNLRLEEDSDDNSDDDEDAASKKKNLLIREVGSDIPYKEETSEVSAGSGSGDKEPSSSAPTIQLEFTLGNMSGNPLMKLLAHDDDDDSSGGSDCVAIDTSDGPSTDARKTAVVDLLREPSEPKSTEPKTNLVLLDSVVGGETNAESTKNAGKKRLITELS